jgi:hypothetical protein
MSRRRNRIAILLGALIAGLGVHSEPLDAQTWRTVTSSRQLWDEKQLNVHVEYAAGRLEVSPSATGLLYQMELRYDEEQFRPLTDYQRDRATLRLGVQSQNRDRGARMSRVHDSSNAKLRLNPQVPTRLRLEFAAGEADVDLGGMALQDLHISVGASQARLRFDSPNRVEAERVKVEAGEADLHVDGLGNARAKRIEVAGGVGNTVLDFGGRWESDAQVSIEMGVGAVTLRVPRSLGVRVSRNSFLTRFSHSGLERRGDGFYNSNWDSAARKLTINVSAAMGAVNLVWID